MVILQGSLNSFSNKHGAMLESPSTTKRAEVSLHIILARTLTHKTHFHVWRSSRRSMRIANHGDITVIFPWCKPSTNETRIFAHLYRVPKHSPLGSAELADINFVSKRTSHVKSLVTTQVLKKSARF